MKTWTLLILAAMAMSATAPKATADYLAPGSFHDDDFVLGPTSPGKWGSPVFGTGATVTWSLMPTGPSYSDSAGSGMITALGSFMPLGFKAQIVAAFAAWSAVANITFVEVTDSGLAFNHPAAIAGDIRLGGHAFDGAGGTLAHGFFPPVNGTTAAGDIHFDIAEPWKIGFGGPGFSIFQVAAHEIGHAIGLSHTGVASSLMNPFYTESFSGPQPDDIAGAQFIYGASTTVPEPGTVVGILSLAMVSVGCVVHRRRKVFAA